MTELTSTAIVPARRRRGTVRGLGQPLAIAALLTLLIGVQLAVAARWPGTFDLAADPAAFENTGP